MSIWQQQFRLTSRFLGGLVGKGCVPLISSPSAQDRRLSRVSFLLRERVRRNVSQRRDGTNGRYEGKQIRLLPTSGNRRPARGWAAGGRRASRRRADLVRGHGRRLRTPAHHDRTRRATHDFPRIAPHGRARSACVQWWRSRAVRRRRGAVRERCEFTAVRRRHVRGNRQSDKNCRADECHHHETQRRAQPGTPHRVPFRVPGRVDYQGRTEINAGNIQDGLTAVKHFPPTRSHFLTIRRNDCCQCAFKEKYRGELLCVMDCCFSTRLRKHGRGSRHVTPAFAGTTDGGRPSFELAPMPGTPSLKAIRYHSRPYARPNRLRVSSTTALAAPEFVGASNVNARQSNRRSMASSEPSSPAGAEGLK